MRLNTIFFYNLVYSVLLFWATLYIQGGPKKVNHYRESSLNRIKNRQPGYIFTNFYNKMSTRILYVRIKYSMYDLICDVISCCF